MLIYDKGFMITLKNGNCLELMRKLKDNSIDLIFCDPPYALGSEIIIRQDGKPDYKIGYELNKEYFEIAKARINNAQSKIENRIL